jgi:hypothetical protein
MLLLAICFRCRPADGLAGLALRPPFIDVGAFDRSERRARKYAQVPNPFAGRRRRLDVACPNAADAGDRCSYICIWEACRSCACRRVTAHRDELSSSWTMASTQGACTELRHHAWPRTTHWFFRRRFRLSKMLGLQDRTATTWSSSSARWCCARADRPVPMLRGRPPSFARAGAEGRTRDALAGCPGLPGIGCGRPAAIGSTSSCTARRRRRST